MLMRWVISLVAVLVGYSLSIVINASVSAATLVGFGIEVGLSDRLDMIAKVGGSEDHLLPFTS